MSFKQLFKTLPQYLLPHHLLSQWMSHLTHSNYKWWKNLMINQIIKLYKVNMLEAHQQDINAYQSFNDFFTRELAPNARPICQQPGSIACPADGEVSQSGIIDDGDIFQAKGKSFTTVDLLGGNQKLADLFAEGHFSTIYLSPKDYHRLHMPVDGTLTEMIHVPGRLFSVNQSTTESVPGLFARNERVVCLFETKNGPMALILVGAIFVSSIETTWHGVVTPPTVSQVRHWQYENNEIFIPKGKEMGRFNMGSTIIVLFGKNKVNWNTDFKAGKKVNLGEMIGSIV